MRCQPSSLHFVGVSYDPNFFFFGFSIGELPSLCEVLCISVPLPLARIDTLNYDYLCIQWMYLLSLLKGLKAPQISRISFRVTHNCLLGGSYPLLGIYL